MQRVSDEEIVHALVAARGVFEARIKAVAHATLPDGCDVVAVALEDIRPSASVLAQIAFVVNVTGNALSKVSGFTRPVIVAVAEVLEAALETKVAVSAAVEPPRSKGAAQPTPWDRLSPILAVIGTGVGVIGFVTFIGGVIVWARLTAAGFPAAPALGVFPRQDLLVIGAQTLVPQVLWAAGAVIALVFAYILLRIFWGRASEEEAALLAGQATRMAAAGMFLFVTFALSLALLVPYGDRLAHWDFAYAAGGIIAAGLLAATIGTLTTRVAYLATATFVIVAVFLGFVGYWRESNEQNVRAAAVVRENKKAMAGIFVAEGSNRVYLARVSLGKDGLIDKARSRLVGMTKDSVTDIAVSDPKPVAEALQQARHLARELCQMEPREPPASDGTIENCRTAAPGAPQP